MAEQAAGQAPATNTPALCVVHLKGRIKARRRSKRAGTEGYAFVLAMPAPDPYSMPQAVEVWASKVLGELGDEVAVKCQVGGYPRSYESTREDEEGYRRKVTVQTADNTLTVL